MCPNTSEGGESINLALGCFAVVRCECSDVDEADDAIVGTGGADNLAAVGVAR
jgi:hypothetical protein